MLLFLFVISVYIKSFLSLVFDSGFFNVSRIFVATWNVAGKSPPSYLSLEDWLHTSPPAEIYVLGYAPLIKKKIVLSSFLMLTF